MLYEEARTYAAVPIENIRERIAWARRTGQANPLPEATGPEVTITIDSVDTGERRRLGRYTARHVVTTVTTDAAPGASTPSGTSKQDGWYLDLPDGGCASADGWSFTNLSGFSVRPGHSAAERDRERVQFRGRARRGFPIEEADGSMKLELVDFSEAPLDDALFTVPAGYRPALVTPYGGFDMTKPDTLLNRAELYCGLLAGWVQSFFR